MTKVRISLLRVRKDAHVQECLDEIDRLNKVLHLSYDEILAGGFCYGLSGREDEILDDFDRKLLETAGKCISRIFNKQEGKP